jgi:histone H3/H4
MASGLGSAHISPMVGQRLRDLVASLDPNYTLDAEAEEQILHLADDFLEKVTKQSMRLAQHRGSKTLDVPDIQLALAKQWGIVIPGLGAPIMRASKPGNRAIAGSASASTPGTDAKKHTAEGVLNESTVKKAKMEGGGAQPPLAAPATGV